jgi:outer membrane protein assembly factor BamB
VIAMTGMRNEEGRPQWERTIDQAVELFGVAMQPDGGHVVAGWLAIAGPATEWARPWVARIEPDGRVGWQRRYELAGAVGRSVVSTSGGATIAAFVAPTGAEGTWMPVLTRLGDDGEVAWARDVRAEGAMESGVRLADLPDDEMALVWNAELLVIGEDGTLHRGWRLESPANLVLVDAVAADDGMALVGRDDAGSWVGLVGHDGALRWQAAVAGEVELDYAGVVRSEHDGGLAFFGGTITSTWVLRLRADGRFDGDCPELSPGEASVVEGRATLEPRTIDSVETSFDAAEESMAVEDDDLAVEVACGEP